MDQRYDLRYAMQQHSHAALAAALGVQPSHRGGHTKQRHKAEHTASGDISSTAHTSGGDSSGGDDCGTPAIGSTDNVRFASGSGGGSGDGGTSAGASDAEDATRASVQRKAGAAFQTSEAAFPARHHGMRGREGNEAAQQPAPTARRA